MRASGFLGPARGTHCTLGWADRGRARGFDTIAGPYIQHSNFARTTFDGRRSLE